MKRFLAVCLVAWMILLAAPSALSEEAPPIEMSAKELMSAYEANTAAADDMYHGQTLSVTGIVNAVDRGLMGLAYVQLGGGDLLEFFAVQCNFTQEREEELFPLRVGQEVTITGVCDGKALSIHLNDCHVTVGAEPSAEEAEQPEGNIPARRILSDYIGNAIAADHTYKAREITVTGILKTVDRDLLDVPYITLGTEDAFEFVLVQCFFSEEDEARLLERTPGEEVTVRGVCEGRVINIQLRNCVLP